MITYVSGTPSVVEGILRNIPAAPKREVSLLPQEEWDRLEAEAFAKPQHRCQLHKNALKGPDVSISQFIEMRKRDGASEEQIIIDLYSADFPQHRFFMYLHRGHIFVRNVINNYIKIYKCIPLLLPSPPLLARSLSESLDTNNQAKILQLPLSVPISPPSPTSASPSQTP